MDICGARRGVGGHQPVNPEEARLRAAGGRGCLPEQRSSLLRTLCFIYSSQGAAKGSAVPADPSSRNAASAVRTAEAPQPRSPG